MKVTLDLKNKKCVVEWEKGDPHFTDTGWAEQPESRFLYCVKKALIKQGYDVIKKRMWEDGHLMSDTQQYIRTRKYMVSNSPEEFCIFNGSYALWDAGIAFNESGRIDLTVVTANEYGG